MEIVAQYAVNGSKQPKRRGHVQPRRPLIALDQPGRLRTADVLGLLAVSHSTLYQRLQSGEAPAPDGRDGGRLFWNTETIRDFLANPKGSPS